jgi:hypothetical protein
MDDKRLSSGFKPYYEIRIEYYYKEDYLPLSLNGSVSLFPDQPRHIPINLAIARMANELFGSICHMAKAKGIQDK